MKIQERYQEFSKFMKYEYEYEYKSYPCPIFQLAHA